ncbi:MAG: phosphoenolpyruvate--protein phosphotransferase [Verrucomicrobia bacterium]|nr:MAG: phosphoenolpyruvate--protein phosphotransferase [Verrucomicrobiota bacterium]
MSEYARSGERILRGIPVSGGVRRGKIVVLGNGREAVPHYEVPAGEMAQEIQRLEQALTRTREGILDVQRKVSNAMGAKDASIFDAHLLVLEDPMLIDEVTRLIQEQKLNAEFAFHQVAEKYGATLSSMDDEYLRERAADLRDVTARVLDNLLGRTTETEVHKLREPCIIISYDLAPSTTALLDRKLVLGFATDAGSKTSHTAIMARSLQIPAVVGLHDASKQLKTGQYVLIDGYNGLLIVNPTDQTLFEYGQLVRKQVNLEEKLRDLRDKPAITLDGVRIMLSANIEQAVDAEHVRACGAEGVGLFRTEYFYLNRETLPTEEEQFQAYRQVAAALKPNPVVIRTVDLGGDKFISHLSMPQELNPFLGWRAIRFCLQERDIFRAQLRAILRASVEGNIKMMYPMISGLEELNQANALVEECRRELQARNVPIGDSIEVGAMIEIPSAVLAADSLARRVKFFSIGTNDLIQYSLAVDRLNEKIAHLYEPTHPAIVRLLKTTVESGRRNGIRVAVCGEMAGDPALVPLLLGLGVDELSVAIPAVPRVKFLIRRIKVSEARELAEFALNCESGSEILARSQDLARRIAPSLFDNQT